MTKPFTVAPSGGGGGGGGTVVPANFATTSSVSVAPISTTPDFTTPLSSERTGPLWSRAHILAKARLARALAAADIMAGDTSDATLTAYIRWVTTSRLLGDISEDVATASVARARQIVAQTLALKGAPDGHHP